jgi:hypothetical protein
LQRKSFCGWESSVIVWSPVVRAVLLQFPQREDMYAGVCALVKYLTPGEFGEIRWITP